MINEVMEDMYGFSQIIEQIVKLKKPLIGHNCFSDIIRIYQNFVDELPKSYRNFKKTIHKTFPTFYDTKHIAYCSRRLFEYTDLIDIAGN